jgi:Protein of unknown function (DUF3768)
MPWFRKHHTCPCGTDWWDEWDCLCNDRCPTCDAEIEPDEHEAIQGGKSAKIRALNDRFRKSLTGGRVMMTAAVSALPDDVRARAIELTRTFDDFTPDNDPHNEHDFAASRSRTRNEKFGTTFSIGDKVMQIENDYDKGAVCKIKYKLLHFMLRRQHARQAANAEHLRQDQRAGGHDRFNLKRSSRGARLLHRAPGISPSCV